MIIKNGQVALADGVLVSADIRADGGRIAEIRVDLSGDDQEIDAQGLYVLPGGIDPHVHFDDPGYTHREDFYHGSCAAASGGITTVIDMPCTSVPPVTSRCNLAQKLQAIEHRSVTDFGLFGGVSAQSFEEDGFRYMAELADSVVGFKTYFVSGMETFGRLNHYQFKCVLEQARDLGRPVLLHAEDYGYVAAATEVFMSEGDSPLHYYQSRPETTEVLAVLTAVELAEETGADLHIVHVGTAAAAEILAQSRATCETCPHYLAFTVDDFVRIGSPLKVAPPIKSAENRGRLWKLVADGMIGFVASDHAPSPAREKATGSIWTDYGGIPGSGTLLPYVFSEGFAAGRLSLKRLLEVTSENAAKRYGIYDRKGSIAVGKDADFALIDPQGEWVVQGSSFLSKGKITPFEGMVLKGRVVKTVLRGRVVYDLDEGVVAPAGYGQWLCPE